MAETTAGELPLAPTGITGFDEVLHGGLPRARAYLLQGQFGTGKTTFALQFLLAGVQAGETGLYFTLAETLDELEQTAHGHGWSLAGLHVHELIPLTMAQFTTRQTVFPTPELELDEFMAEIGRVLDEVKPDRVVFDSLTELRLLTATPVRYRHLLLVLRQRLWKQRCTVLLLNNDGQEEGDAILDSLVHGVIALRRFTPDYGPTRRSLEITKLRGRAYHEGAHDFRIHTGGLVVFPRLALTSGSADDWHTLSSGVPGLDTLLGGGLETGTACLLTGPAGTGKSTLATLYVQAALQRGEPAAVFLFDERPATWFKRVTNLRWDMQAAVTQGLLDVRYLNTGELSPGEFADLLRQQVEKRQVKVVVIDSLTGYLNAMAGEKLLLNQLHELLTYLAQWQVLTLLVVTQHGVLPNSSTTSLDVSYLADTVLLLRHFEAEGAVHQAVSVMKKRYAAHERTIRQLTIQADGVKVGLPLSGFQGVLSGYPQYSGETPLLGHTPAGEADNAPDQ